MLQAAGVLTKACRLFAAWAIHLSCILVHNLEKTSPVVRPCPALLQRVAPDDALVVLLHVQYELVDVATSTRRHGDTGQRNLSHEFWVLCTALAEQLDDLHL